jgi:hypothetical protein
MLAQRFRWWCVNQTGESLTSGDVVIEGQFWRLVDGVLTYSADYSADNIATIADTAADDVNDTGSSETSYDNSSTPQWGFKGTAAVTTGTGGAGTYVEIWIQDSNDGDDAAGSWPTEDRDGVLLCVIETPSGSTYRRNIRI